MSSEKKILGSIKKAERDAAAALTTGTVIAAYCTIVGEPTFDTLSAGLYDI